MKMNSDILYTPPSTASATLPPLGGRSAQLSTQSPGGSAGRELRENSSLLTIVKAQVNFLVSTLSDDNFDRNSHEIGSLCDQHGVEAELHFIRRIIQISALEPSAPLPFRLLVQETQKLARDPSKADRFRDAIERGEGDVFRVFDLANLLTAIELSPLEKVVLSASVALSVARSDLAAQGKAVLVKEFDEGMNQFAHSPVFEDSDLTAADSAKLLSTLLCEPPFEGPILSAFQRANVLSAIRTRFGVQASRPILKEVIPTMSLEPGTSLADTVLSFGVDLLSDADVIRALLSRFGITDSSPPSDNQMIEIFTGFSEAAAAGVVVPDVSTFVAVLGGFTPPLNWSEIASAFDQPNRQVVDTPTLKLLVAILLSSPKDVPYPAVTGFWKIWSNTLYQLRLLDALLALPSDTFSFVVLPGRRIITAEEVGSASATIKALAANVQTNTWNSLDLIEYLVKLAELDSLELNQAARELLDKAVKVSAELVEMGLLKLPKPWTPTHADYVDKLLQMFLAGHPNHQLVLMRVFQTDEAYLMGALLDFYQISEPNVTRILDIAQDLKILDKLLSTQPFGFALDLAALASRREYLNLDKWLSDNYALHGDAFAHAIMEFLDHKVKNEMPRDSTAELRTMSLNAQTIAIFLAFLRRSGNDWSRTDIEYFREIRNSCLQLHPRLMNLAPGSDHEPGMAVVSFAPDIESESETVFKKMYEEEVSIDSVLHLLQQYKESTVPRDHEVFACMLHTLFDEYKFFPVYPPRELAITAVLFGSLIQFHLVEFIPLGIAIRYVLDALRQSPESNMFKFGIQALAGFESRLGEWRELCQALLAIPHLQEERPDLAESARRALFQAEGANGFEQIPNSEVDGVIDGSDSTNPVFHALQPDNLSDENIVTPNEEEADQMLFIVNNLAINNCETKASDMRDVFKDEHSRWFAHYLIHQRLSSEPNNHELYVQFLEQLNRDLLQKHVLNEAFIKARALLNSDSALHSAAERSMLKNLGSWLGVVTLARDKPIKHRNLAFKNLLLEGYDSGRLIVAIPLVCKILEQCAKSTIFHLPNPWLMGLMRLLSEFYHFGDLILNLKFEIEVLCIALDIDLDKIEPTALLRQRPILDVDPSNAAADYVGDMDGMPMDGYGSLLHLDSQLHTSLPLDTSGSVGQPLSLQAEGIIATLDGAIVINPQLGHYAENDSFKRLVQLAMEGAVREIIMPVVDRSVTIASISTRELVNKDFAMETDEERMQTAAHLMVRNLAGNLALVTCKEPLRINMISHLRSILNEQGINEQMFSEQAVLLLVQDNLGAACNVIEKAAMERAVAEVDKALETAYVARLRHREQRPGQPFWGTSPASSSLQSKWPDMLRIDPGGLHVAQTRVYEDFGASSRRMASHSILGPNSFPRNEGASGSYNDARIEDESELVEPDGDAEPEPSLSHEACMERANVLISQLNAFIAETAIQTLPALPEGHEVVDAMHQLLDVPLQSENRERTGLALAQKIAQLLYKSTSTLSREVYVVVLQQLCKSLPDVSKEVVDWLIHADDERKLNVPVTLALLRAGLIANRELDVSIGRAVVREYRPTYVDFAAALVRETLVNDAASGLRNEFPVCFQALLRAASVGKATESAVALIHEIQGPEEKEPYNTLALYFKEWVRSYHQSSAVESSFIQFVTHPEMQAILRGEDISSLFFRVCTEVSVERCSAQLAAGVSTNVYLYMDALSKLIAMIIKYHGEANNEHAKAHYLTKTLSIIVLVLAHGHEESDGVDFESKPFFRLFSSLLNDLQGIYSHSYTTHFQLLLALSDTFNTLQPAYFPGFAFSWMALISHRAFMAKMLQAENREGWAPFHRLLVALLRFLGAFLRTGKLDDPSRELYQGTLRMMVVLLHDFPEFLSEYYFTICDVIPANCTQLRNVVLSAFPSNQKLPDPFAPRNLAIEHLPEMGPIPPILSEFTSALKNGDLRASLDQFLLNRGSPSFPATLVSRLLLPAEAMPRTGETYNLPVLNALVMYVGVSSVAQAKARSGALGFISTDPGVQLMHRLATDLDPEGQHHLLSSIVTHLRYPNAHTHWFSSLALFLFLEVPSPSFQEIMTTVLLERFLVHKPHPWGAIVTFVELLRHPRYDFWSREFLHRKESLEMSVLLSSLYATL